MQATIRLHHVFHRVMALEQRYQREIVFILCAGLSSFLFTALASYYPWDNTLFSGSAPLGDTRNLAGRLGANLSALLYFYFGMVGFFLPLLILSSGVLIFNRRRVMTASRLGGASLCFICLLVCFSYFYPTVQVFSLPLYSGGVIGHKILSFAISWLGEVGAAIVCLSLMTASLLALTQTNLIGQGCTLVKKTPLEVKKRLFSRPFFRKITSWQAQKNSIALAGVTDSHPQLSQPECQTDDKKLESLAPSQTLVQTPAKNPNYQTPPVAIFKRSDQTAAISHAQKQEFEQISETLVATFSDFGIKGQVVAIQPGPVVTVFEFQPESGVKLSKITGLVDDLALALRVDAIILNPVRGKRAVGIQVPNSVREIVRLGDILRSDAYQSMSSPLAIALGKGLSGQPLAANLQSMPHLLVAGATGSGKSVAINSLLCSIIMKASPEQVRLILVDPKMLELSVYEGIPHLLMPVITEARKASLALKWATHEMERRYKLMQTARVRHIDAYNELIKTAPTERIEAIKLLNQNANPCPLPYIVLVIDELADLMLTAAKEVETYIQRLAQKARASGIHLVLATQRPSVDVITGVIKANLPCRAAFQVVSKHDSRTILDQNGADKLLGNGDFLLQKPGASRLERLQGAFVTDDEVNAMVASLREDNLDYDERIIQWIDEQAQQLNQDQSELAISSDDEPKFAQAIEIARTQGSISASFLQRQLKIGYNRAARIVETMEAQGLIAPADGVKPRKWIGDAHKDSAE